MLAGDPLQLGPVILSAVAKQNGLEMSLLERFTKTLELYARNTQQHPLNSGYDARAITMLVDNYRSHQAIIHVPSERFYNNELKSCADPALIEQFRAWSQLPQKEFPLIFHGIVGEDEREGNSPSWFNRSEAIVVLEYCKKLSQFKGLSVEYVDL